MNTQINLQKEFTKGFIKHLSKIRFDNSTFDGANKNYNYFNDYYQSIKLVQNDWSEDDKKVSNIFNVDNLNELPEEILEYVNEIGADCMMDATEKLQEQWIEKAKEGDWDFFDYDSDEAKEAWEDGEDSFNEFVDYLREWEAFGAWNFLYNELKEYVYDFEEEIEKKAKKIVKAFIKEDGELFFPGWNQYESSYNINEKKFKISECMEHEESDEEWLLSCINGANIIEWEGDIKEVLKEQF